MEAGRGRLSDLLESKLQVLVSQPPLVLEVELRPSA